MRARWLFAFVLLLLVIAALTFSRWFPAFMSFIGANSDAIQGLADLIQLTLWIGAGVLAWFGLLHRPKTRQTHPASAPPGENVSATPQEGERSVKIVGPAYGNVVITGDYNKVGDLKPEVEESSLHTAYLHHVYENTSHLTLSGIDRKTASEAEARLNLSAVYTALLTFSDINSTPIEELDLSSETYAALKQAGISTVGEVFRLLQAGDETIPSIRNFGEKGLEELRQIMASKGMLSLRNETAHRSHSYSALEQLNRYDRLVLLGEPGSGKSTFVNFVVLCLAGEALGKTPNLETLTAPLPADEDRSGDREHEPRLQEWKHGALLPVRIILRDFAARGLPPAGQKTSARHLWDFIAVELEDCALGDYAPFLRKHLLEQGGLLMLDGLDEVPEAEQRRTQIKTAVEDFTSSFPKCRILATSRTYAYQKQDWQLEGYVETILAPFSTGQIKHFVDRWYAHIAVLRHLNQQDAQGRAELLKRAIFSSERLRELAERPLLLTLMASLHAWRGGTLPEKREELYAATVDLLLDWWESQRVVRNAKGEVTLMQPSLAEWLKVDRLSVRGLLNELAYQAHAAQPELTGTADVPEEPLVAGLLRISQNPDVKPARLVEFLTTRAGLLLPRGVGVYTFPHRTFQEYLAACHLTDVGYPEQVADLARTAPDRWREVALLAGAKATRGGGFALWPLVDALCGSQPSAKSDPPDLWGALLAGQAILENANLQQISSTNQAKVDRVRDWQLHILKTAYLPALERASAGNVLARLGDPRFDPDCWHLPAEALLGFVEIPTGPFLMGSDPERDKDAYGDERPQHEVRLPAYYIARYPVTVAQFRCFVEESKYEPATPRCLEGVDNHPVVYVTWRDALAYCRWLGEKLSALGVQRLAGKGVSATERAFWQDLVEERLVVTMPSEAEWEKAARGVDGCIYPWGDEFEPDRANAEMKIGGNSAVGCFPLGASPYEVQDLSGNVWEWTRSRDSKYPYDPEDGREDLKGGDPRVLRGGAFYPYPRDVRCAYRYGSNPDSRYYNVGFRVVVSLLPLDAGDAGPLGR